MQHVILVGMAGAGKSTIGQKLASRMGLAFIDTDAWLTEKEGLALQALLEQQGITGYKAAEERAVLTLPLRGRSVVATGGSVIYSPKAISALKALGYVVYLRASFEVILQRVDNWNARGFVAESGLSLSQIYNEREPLYKAAADGIVDVDYLSVDEVVDRIVKSIR